MSKQPKPLPSLDSLQPKLKFGRVMALIGYVGVLATLLIYNGVYANLHGANPLAILATLLLPLLIFLPGMLMGGVLTDAWLCFVINLYFIHGVLAALQADTQIYGGLLIFFCVLFFIPAMGYVRWGFQAKRIAEGET